MKNVYAFLFTLMLILCALPATAQAQEEEDDLSTDLQWIASTVTVASTVSAQSGSSGQSQKLGDPAKSLVGNLLRDARDGARRASNANTHTSVNASKKGDAAIYRSLAKTLSRLTEQAESIRPGEGIARWSKLAAGIEALRVRVVALGGSRDTQFAVKVDAAALRFLVGANGKAPTVKYLGATGLLSLDSIGLGAGKGVNTRSVGARLVAALERDPKLRASAKQLRGALSSLQGASHGTSCKPPYCATSPKLTSSLTSVGQAASAVASKLGVNAIIGNLDRLSPIPPNFNPNG